MTSSGSLRTAESWDVPVSFSCIAYITVDHWRSCLCLSIVSWGQDSLLTSADNPSNHSSPIFLSKKNYCRVILDWGGFQLPYHLLLGSVKRKCCNQGVQSSIFSDFFWGYSNGLNKQQCTHAKKPFLRWPKNTKREWTTSDFHPPHLLPKLQWSCRKKLWSCSTASRLNLKSSTSIWMIHTFHQGWNVGWRIPHTL